MTPEVWLGGRNRSEELGPIHVALSFFCSSSSGDRRSTVFGRKLTGYQRGHLGGYCSNNNVKILGWAVEIR